MNFHRALPGLLPLVFPTALLAQPRSLAQDSSLNNLRHAPGVAIAPDGTLGNVRKVGTGPRTMLLIPGLGFGDGIWSEFMERHAADYTMYAITLPGFGGTAPLALPPEGSSYSETPWTNSAIRAIDSLMSRERIGRYTIVAHWALATQIAVRLALSHPDRIDAVVLVGGPLKSFYENVQGMANWTTEQRIRANDRLGQAWFKTVTRQTWDDNNFMSYDYAINPRRGLFLWREAQQPSLPVWIRYLLEFYSFDQSSLKDLKVPTLVAQPGFDDPAFYVEPGRNYMRNLCIDSWNGAKGLSDRLEFATVPQSRLFIMFDQPEALDRLLSDFLARVSSNTTGSAMKR